MNKCMPYCLWRLELPLPWDDALSWPILCWRLKQMPLSLTSSWPIALKGSQPTGSPGCHSHIPSDTINSFFAGSTHFSLPLSSSPCAWQSLSLSSLLVAFSFILCFFPFSSFFFSLPLFPY